jgi:HEAT repeat protein
MLLKDRKKSVRKTAAWALGVIGDDRAISGLTGSLKDDDGSVRSAAQEALALIRDRKQKMDIDGAVHG